MMNDLNVPPVDSVKAFLQFVEFLRSPKEAEALTKRLLAAMEAHAASQANLKTATAALNDLKSETETAVATLRDKAAEKIAADSADYDKRTAERENGLAAREKRAADLLVKAQADSEAAAKMKARLDEKMRLLSA
jgi:hypothetical protein